MDTEPPRVAMTLAAFGGAAVWGTYTLVVAFFAGEPLAGRDLLKALVNVAAGIFVGLLVAWFLGPTLLEFAPVVWLKNPEVVGFGIGFGAWEFVPWAVREMPRLAKRFAREKA